MLSPFRERSRGPLRWLASGLLTAAAIGCASVPQTKLESSALPPLPSSVRKADGAITKVAYQEPVGKASPPAPVPVSGPAEVDELVQMAVSRNPRLAKASFAIDSAKGKHIQAGLYPNPDLAVNWDEIGDRTASGGILSLPRFSQPIVTGRKLSLSQAVVATEVSQATLALLTERYSVVGGVRAAFYDVYTLERRVVILDELVKLAGDAVKNGQVLLENKQIARLDLVQLEVELARFRAEAEATRREIPSARKRLAATVGDPRLALGEIVGPFEQPPVYDPERSLEIVLTTHPEVRNAKVGIERAQAALRRAEAEPIPNVTFSTGYIRQFENRSHDFALGLSAPIPVWNRNQGNIFSAKAQLGEAIQDVGRVENELTERVAIATRTYSGAMKRAEQYRTEIIPKAEETYKLSLEAFKGGQFEYLRVVQAQRTVAEARLESNRALGEAWRAAAELSALLLEEWWPGPPPRPKLGAGPVLMPEAEKKPR